MIKANELRAGNWVNITQSPFKDELGIREISSQGIMYYEQSLKDDFDLLLEPIPLTPEILEKSKCWGMWGDGTWTDGQCEYQYNFETKMFSTHSEVDGAGWQLRKVEYLHDFQNLYFALTGEELQISL